MTGRSLASQGIVPSGRLFFAMGWRQYCSKKREEKLVKNADWVDQGPPEAPLPEQTFFDDPAIDRVFAVTMALATEVWVLKDRVMALEAALAKTGAVDPARLDAEPDQEDRATRANERQAFVAGLLDNLTGRQRSAGALEEAN